MRILFNFLLLPFCLSGQPYLKAQQPNLKQQDSIREFIASKFGPAAARLDLVKYNTSIVVNQDTFFNPGGFNYLFLLKNGEVYRVDQCYFHGANFNRYLFSHDNVIYQLGGYGNFTTNNHLLRFSFLSKEWEMVKTNGQRPAFIQGICFIKNDSLFSFNNRRGGNGVEPDSIDPHLYILNLKNYSWQRLPMRRALNEFVLNYETPDFYYCTTQSRVLLLNKKRVSFEIIENLGEAFIKTPALRNDGNSLIFEPGSSSNIDNELTLDLDSLWQKHQSKIEEFFSLAELENNENKRSIFGFGAVLLLFLLLLVFLWWSKRKNQKIQAPSSEENQPAQESQSDHYYRKLIASEQALLTMEELDLLLGIDYMEADSRKLRRHRLMQELQENYPGLITRIKDEKDRRRFLYRIRNEP